MVDFLIKSLWLIEYRLEINGIIAGCGCIIYFKSTTLQLLYMKHENFDWWSKCTFPWIAYLGKCEAHQWEMLDNGAIHEPLQALPASQICGVTKGIKKIELLEWTFPAFDRSEDIKRDQCLAKDVEVSVLQLNTTSTWFLTFDGSLTCKKCLKHLKEWSHYCKNLECYLEELRANVKTGYDSDPSLISSLFFFF